MNFAELSERISPALKGITYRLKGHCCFLDEKDLYQEALVHLWKGFQAGKFNDKTDSYILQSCYFYLKNYLRKIKINTQAVSLEMFIRDSADGRLEEKIFLERSSENYQDYLDYLDNKMLAQVIRDNGFSQREKSILSFLSEGLATRAIGARLGISHVRVIKLVRRIRDKCKKHSF